MGKGERKLGRPTATEERTPLKVVTFKADPACLEALKRLQKEIPPSVRSKRSVAIRKALLDAAGALDRKTVPPGLN